MKCVVGVFISSYLLLKVNVVGVILVIFVSLFIVMLNVVL